MALKFKQGRTQFLIDALQPDRLTRIVDVGANPINDNPYKPLLDMGACEVYGFERHPEAYAQLLQNKGDREHYYPFAVGDGNSGTLKITSGSGFSSLLEPNENFWTYTGRFHRGMRILDRVHVETKRLDEVEGLPEFDLMKIDIQGGETAVFDNGTRVLSNALAVISEVAAIPLYEDQPLLDDQMASLRKVGFHLHKFLFFKALRCTNPFSRQFSAGLHKNQLSDGDAVFVRGLMDLNSLSDENLKHLSILAESVIMSADLVTVALREVINREVIGDEVAKTYVNKVNRTSKA